MPKLKYLLTAQIVLSLYTSTSAAPTSTQALSGPNDPSTSGDEVTFASDVSSGDLLHGIVGTGGTWNQTPEGLNDGNPGGDFEADGGLALAGAAYAADGDSVSFREFVLGTGTSGLGYDINSIQSIAAWTASGFSNQKYEVRMRLVGEVSFSVDPLYTVDYQPFNAATEGGSSKIEVTDDGLLGILASGVEAIRFDILDTTSVDAGGVVMREIDVFGLETQAAEAGSAIQLAFADYVSSSDLINGLTPVSAGFTLANGAHPDQLTDGILGMDSATQSNPIDGAWAQNGASVEYTLGTGANGFGYDINVIRSIAAWAGLGSQLWSVEVKNANEDVWRPLDTVDYQPAGTTTTMVTLGNEESTLATGIVAIRFVAAGQFIWRELDVFGESATVADTSRANSTTELTYNADVSNSDLLHGLTASVQSGWGTPVASLNDGVHGISFDDLTTPGTIDGAYSPAGGIAEYDLGFGANGTGYDISSIQSIAAWNGSSLGNQKFTIEVLPIGGTWTTLDTIDYQPLTGAGATKATLTDASGTLATGIYKIRFTTDAAVPTVLREIDVFGTDTATGNPTAMYDLASQQTYSGDVSAADLLHGLTPVATGWNPGTTLNDGVHGGDDSGAALTPNPTQSTAVTEFTLGYGANGTGYDISSIASFAAWSGAGFANQAWTVEVLPVGGSWITLDSVDFQPSPVSYATKYTLNDPSGTLAAGIYKIRFTANYVDTVFTDDTHALYGIFAWRELDVFGTDTAAGGSTGMSSTTELLYAGDVSDSDLIDGLTPTTTGTWQTAIAYLNDGDHGQSFDTVGIIEGAHTTPGATAEYTLGAGVDGTGYDITSIQSIAAWNSFTFGNQAFTVEVKPVGGSWTTLDTVDFQPLDDLVTPGGASKYTLNDPSGTLASGIEAIRFTANSVDGSVNAGSFVWRELDVFGAATGQNMSSTTELDYINDASMSDLLHLAAPTFSTGWTSATPLTDGVHGGTFVTVIEGGFASAGATAEYTLGSGANGTGYDITSIQTIAAWNSAAFGNQKWTVEVRPVGGSWTALDSVDFQPFTAPDPGATKVTLLHPRGTLATGVEAIRFVTDAAVGSVMREIDVFGTDTAGALDTTPPSLLSLSPVNATDRISTMTKLVATFDENIALGTGDVTITNLDTLAQTTITLPDGAQVAIDAVDGTKLSITPSTELSQGTNYAVQFAATVVDDLAGNSHAGITDNTTWTFTTSYLPLRILPIGDSITAGYTDNPLWTDQFTFGYRSHLYTLLRNAGYDIQFLGDSAQPWNNFSGDPSAGGTYKPVFDLRDIGQDKHQGGEGATIAAIQTWINTHDPDVVLLKIGINSIQVGTQFETVRDNIFGLVDSVMTSKPEAHVIVAQIIPYVGDYTTFPDNAGRNSVLHQYNVYIRDTLSTDLANAGHDVSKYSTVDMYSMFLTDPNDYDSAVATGRHSNGFNHPWNIAVGGAGYDTMAQQWFNTIEALDFGPDSFRSYMTDPAFGLGVNDLSTDGDPDGDDLSSALEAWLGTNPGVANTVSLSALTTNGTVTSFEHPQNPNVPSDISGYYEWSMNLSDWYAGDGIDGPGSGEKVNINAVPAGSTSTATATASEELPQLFLRTGATQD